MVQQVAKQIGCGNTAEEVEIHGDVQLVNLEIEEDITKGLFGPRK
jgi:hypothetical protein